MTGCAADVQKHASTPTPSTEQSTRSSPRATLVRAAEHAGVNERTVRRWLGEDEFRARLDDQRLDISQRVAASLSQASTLAVSVLVHRH